jgi:hypothetical protein
MELKDFRRRVARIAVGRYLVITIINNSCNNWCRIDSTFSLAVAQTPSSLTV